MLFRSFVEVKDGTKPPSARRLTPDEERWHAEVRAFGAEVRVVTQAYQVEDAF